MISIIHPSILTGNISVPASKSVAQRALAIALIRKGITTLYNCGNSADEQAMLQILKQVGCYISQEENQVTIDSSSAGIDDGATYNFIESGLAVRMMSPLLATSEASFTVAGEGSLLQRSMQFMKDVFPAVGVSIISGSDHLPLQLKGPFTPTSITVDGSVSSQFITGLILAFTAANATDVVINVTNPVSKPYLSLTLKVMSDMGLPIPGYDASHEFFRFKGSNKTFAGNVEHTIEGDWSSAAFLLVAGAIAGEVNVKGLDVFSEQGDKTVMQAIMESGARMSISTEEIIARKSALKAFHFNAIDHPDLVPPLAVLGACCTGTSVIEGMHRLVHKESNRAITLQEEFGKMGIEISFQDDMMLIKGGQRIQSATVNGRCDHRIVMACAVAALVAEGPVTIEGAEAVNKSWPSFFIDLQTLGAKIDIG